MRDSHDAIPEPCFFDTNVLIYATIDQDSSKQRQAATLIARAIADGTFAISAQVLKEFANTLIKKSDKPLEAIRESVERFSPYSIVANSPLLVVRALDLCKAFGLQFFDALLVAGAESAGCRTLFSEDMTDGATYGSVSVRNPFV